MGCFIHFWYIDLASLQLKMREISFWNILNSNFPIFAISSASETQSANSLKQSAGESLGEEKKSLKDFSVAGCGSWDRQFDTCFKKKIAQNICFMTQCQDEFRNLSGCVIKILTASRILQISIAWCQIEAEIHSFPTMYGKGGVDVVKIGEIKVFVQKLCLKQGFFEDTNLDHLTSGWPGAHCFSGDANFDMFPKKYG